MTGLCKRLLLMLIFMFTLVRSTACIAERSVLRISDGKIISFSRMMKELRGIRVVVIGENHENPGHHRIQLDVIKAVHGAGTPLVLGLEMFSADTQPELDHWARGELDEPAFIGVYQHSWQIPWPLYRDIFHYARDHRLTLIGLNLQQNLARKVAREGFASLTASELKEVPSGITCNVDAVYMAFIKRAFSSHFRDEKTLLRFCEAQKLWNTSMALRIIDFQKKNPRHTIIVLTGAGHALKGGLPAEIGHASRLSCKVILPEFPELKRNSVTLDDADYLILE